MKINKRLYVYLPSCFVFFIALSGLLFGFLDLSFEPWSQIVFYNKLDISEPTIGIASHLSRYAVVFPAYLVSQAYDADVGYIYTLYILVVVFLISLCWASLSICRTENRILVSIISCTPYFLLPLINGRFAFALCGLSLAHCSIYLPFLTKRPFLNILIRLISLLLASVSSGTFMVAACIVISPRLCNASTRIFLSLRRASLPLTNISFFSPPRFFSTKKISAYKILISYINFLVLLLVAVLTVLFIHKNLSYFSERDIIEALYQMLSHGLGFIFNPSKTLEECGSIDTSQSLISSCMFAFQIETSPLLSVAVVTSFICLAFWQFSMIANSRRLDDTLKITIYASVFFGLFGLTTLMSIISIVPLALPVLRIRA